MSPQASLWPKRVGLQPNPTGIKNAAILGADGLKIAAAQIQGFQQVPPPPGEPYFHLPGRLLAGPEPGHQLDRPSVAQHILVYIASLFQLKHRPQMEF